MTTLKELAATLEMVGGPVREIDNKIATVLDGWSASDVVGFYDLMHIHKPLPKYTSSIDAALALVERRLPGIAFRLTYTDEPPNDHWSFTFKVIWEKLFCAPTAPLAILRALVAALIAQEKTDEA